MLRRFGAYLEKIFGFASQVDTLKDERIGAQIPTASLWLSVFWMFTLRLRSFNALEQELRRPGRLKKLIGHRTPSADALGYGLGKFTIFDLPPAVYWWPLWIPFVMVDVPMSAIADTLFLPYTAPRSLNHK